MLGFILYVIIGFVAMGLLLAFGPLVLVVAVGVPIVLHYRRRP